MATKRTLVPARGKQTYDRMHRAWRAGAIDDFYFGRHSPSDARLVWRLDLGDGSVHEWNADGDKAYHVETVAQINGLLDTALAARGLADVEWGDQWVGFRSVVLVGVDGLRLVMGYGTARYEEVAA